MRVAWRAMTLADRKWLSNRYLIMHGVRCGKYAA